MTAAVRARPGRAARVTILSGLALLSSASLVSGHSALDTANPGPDQVLAEVPAELVARFTQDLDTERSFIEVRDAAGGIVVRGSRDPERVRILRATLPDLAPGDYTVRWQTFSTEDGELFRDTYRFTVTAAPSPAASAAATGKPSIKPGRAAIPATPAASTSPAPPTTDPAPSATPGASSSESPPVGPGSAGGGSGGDGMDALLPVAAALLVAGAAALWLFRRKPA